MTPDNRVQTLMRSKLDIVLVLLIAAGFAFHAWTALANHNAFGTHAFDLGLFSQAAFNSASGRGLTSSILGRPILGEHFSPILYLCTPLYMIWGDARVLLIVQSFALALAAWPLCRIARHYKHPRWIRYVIIFVFLIYPPLGWLNLRDFHPIALVAPLLLGLFSELSRGNMRWAALWGALALCCKEEVGLLFVFLGIYAFFLVNKRAGVVLALAGLAQFVLAVYVVIPWFRGADFVFFSDRYAHLGGSFGGIAAHLFLHPVDTLKYLFTPDRFKTLAVLFFPTGGLAFLSPAALAVSLPTFAQNFLSNYAENYHPRFHYHAPAIPIIFIATTIGLSRLRSSKFPALNRFPGHWTAAAGAILMLLCSIIGYRYCAPGVCSQEFSIYDYKRSPRQDRAAEMIARIPSKASVTAQGVYVPHLSERETIHPFPWFHPTEYVLTDPETEWGPLPNREDLIDNYLRIMDDPRFRTLDFHEGLALLKWAPDQADGTDRDSLRVKRSADFPELDGYLQSLAPLIAIDPDMPHPQLIAPENNAAFAGVPSEFQWSVVPGATEYQIQLITDTELPVSVRFRVTDARFRLRPQGWAYLGAGKYKWSVRALFENRYGPESAPFCLSISK